MRPLSLTMQAFGPFAGRQSIDFTGFSQGPILISGPTGSGKTMIFDAISYALFNQTSGESRNPDELRSHFADLDKDTYVELVFLVDKQDKYKIRRSPPYVRQSKRGTGLVSVNASCQLHLPNGQILTKQGEVKEKLEQVLGLDASQFKQTALLAQGEFTKLLRASSKERVEIFRSIFQTQRARSLQDHLGKSYIQAQASYVQALNGIYQVLGQLPQSFRQTYSDRLDPQADQSSLEVKHMLDLCSQHNLTLEAELRQLGKRLGELKAKSEGLQKQIGQAESLLAWGQELGIAKDRLKAWQAGAKDQADREQSLSLAQLALEIKSGFVRLAEARQEAKDLEQRNLELSQASAKQAEAELVLARDLGQLATWQTELKDQEKLLVAYQDQAARGQEWQGLQAKIKELEQGLTKGQSQVSRYQAEAGELGAKLKLFELFDSQQLELSRRQQEHIQGIEHLGQVIQSLEQLARIQEEVYKNYAEQVELELKLLKTGQAAKAADQDLAQASQSFNLEHAGRLAKDLKPGLACPVCGSLNHPKPACLSPQAITQAKLDELSLTAGSLASQLSVESSRLDQLKLELKQSLKQFKQALLASRALFDHLFPDNLSRGFYHDEFATIPATLAHLPEEPEESLEVYEAIRDAVDHLIVALNKLRGEEQVRLDGVTGELADLSQTLASRPEVNRALDELQEKIKKEETDQLSKQVSLAKLEEKSDQLAKGLEVGDLESLGTRQETAGKQIETLEAKIKDLLKSEKDHLQKTTELETKTKEVQARLTENSQIQTRLEAEIRTFCQEKQVELGQIEAWIDQDQDLADLQKQVEQYRLEGRQIEEKIKDMQGQIEVGLKALELEDKVQIEGYLEQKKQAQTELEQQIVELTKQELQGQNDRSHYLDQAGLLAAEAKKLAGLEMEYLEIEVLAKAAQGNLRSGLRRDFESYLQAYYFELVLQAASKRFLLMTDGRYELRQRQEVSDLRRRTGLDLDVFDRYSNRARPVGTLSGGESFKAALAFALALSDLAQAASAVRRIDCLFVDEGFGSLDNRSLESALDCLLDLEDDNRLVAVISHVGLLAEAIPSQIQIKKTGLGSQLACKY